MQHYTSNGTIIETFVPSDVLTQNLVIKKPLNQLNTNDAITQITQDKTALLQAISELQDATIQKDKQQHQQTILQHSANIKQALVLIQNQCKHMIRTALQTSGDVMTPDSSTEMAEYIVIAQQKLNTTRHLAKQSHELYLRQRRLMWIWVSLCVVLAVGAAVFCFWLHTLRTPRESDLIQNTPPVKEIFDSQYAQPSTMLDNEEDDDEYDEEDEEDEYALDERDEAEAPDNEEAREETARKADERAAEARKADERATEARKEEQQEEEDDSSSV